jgi:hypothetical protein
MDCFEAEIFAGWNGPGGELCLLAQAGISE